MQTLIPLREPELHGPASPSWRAFLELGFRPLYLAGAVWALLAVLIWIFAPQVPAGALAGLPWHAHEMLWGFVATIAVGFLLTAGANWTGITPLAGAPLGALLVLWVVARAGYLLPLGAAFWAAAAADTLFFVVAAAAMGRVVWRARNRRNYPVPFMMLGLGLAHVGFLVALVGMDDWALALRGFHAGLGVMALIALLVARRVIPFFAMRAVPGLQIPMHERSGQWQLVAAAVAIAALLAGWSWLQASALALAGSLALWQVLAWRPAAVRGRPLLWILYAGYSGLGVGLLASAAHAVGVAMPSALSVHLVAMAGFSTLIIGMLTRTALGHLGRGLVLDRSMVASYWLMIGAVALRLAAAWPLAAGGWLLQASAACWAAAFATYLWRFTPWMIRPRPDRPVPPPPPPRQS
jgi:uncharacterized protein involved in response to NO